jgi:hypothetical protein
MVTAESEHVEMSVDLEGSGRLTRRRLGRLPLVGAAFVGTLAKMWADTPSALAANKYCCDLRYPNGPWCGGTEGSSSFTCPANHFKKNWTCCMPFGLVLCWECTENPNTCMLGPYSCSNYSFGPPSCSP